MSTFTTKAFGRQKAIEYTDSAATYALVTLRIVMGWVLFQGGIVKLFDSEWSASGFLANAIPEGNPFTAQFAGMAGSPVIDFLVPWGLTLTGLGLIFGALVRWNAFWGAFMMVMFWAASLTGGISQGLPVAHGWFIDDHIVYAALLFGLGAFGAGRILGADSIIEKSSLVERMPWLKFLLG